MDVHMTKCKHDKCNNKFIGTGDNGYCSDPVCISRRRIKIESDSSDSTNIKIAKGSFGSGSILILRCSCVGPSGRCPNKYVVTYDRAREVYPMFCHEHRNEYKRSRFIGTVKQQNFYRELYKVS
jgi:hypothetical protein